MNSSDGAFLFRREIVEKQCPPFIRQGRRLPAPARQRKRLPHCRTSVRNGRYVRARGTVLRAVGAEGQWAGSECWPPGSESTQGTHGPSTITASSSPGQGGRAVQVKTRGTLPVQRY